MFSQGQGHATPLPGDLRICEFYEHETSLSSFVVPAPGMGVCSICIPLLQQLSKSPHGNFVLPDNSRQLAICHFLNAWKSSRFREG
jgi:hypothetical protein